MAIIRSRPAAVSASAVDMGSFATVLEQVQTRLSAEGAMTRQQAALMADEIVQLVAAFAVAWAES